MGISAIVGLVGIFVPFLNGQSASPERHSLYYVYTALSKPVEAPGIYEFIGMGVLDGRKIDYYNSAEKIKVPEQQWMKEKLPPDYWEKGTQSRRSKEQWFKVNVNILMERNRQNGSDVHVLNWRHGCEVEKQPDGSSKFIRGADEYSYDGQDFLAFDDASMQWVAPVPEAVPTKQKWDGVPILNQYTKGYLEKECVDWLDKFVHYANGDLIAASPPEVHLFARTSKSCEDNLSMTCLATGFLPKDIVMSIRKNKTPVVEAHDRDVYPNGDGTHQARLHVDFPKSEANDYDCFVSHRALSAHIVRKWELDGILCDESSTSTGMIAGLAVAATVGIIMIVLAVCFGLKKCKETDEKKPKLDEEQHLRDSSSEGSKDSGLDSDMRILLLGSRFGGKSSSGNTILGRKKFGTSGKRAECVKREGETEGRHITVVEAPGWGKNCTVEETPEHDVQEIIRSVSLCPPGPNALLLVINVSDSFIETDRRAVQEHLELLGETVWSHTIVLFTRGNWLGDTTIEQHIESGGQALKWVVEKCGNRYHVVENKKSDGGQVKQLLKKIEEMLAEEKTRAEEREMVKKQGETLRSSPDSSPGGSKDSGLDAAYSSSPDKDSKGSNDPIV